MKILLLSILFSAILLTSAIAGSTQPVSASEGYFENDYGKQVSHPPTVCIFQPDDSRINETTWKIWYTDTKRGIDIWRSVLEQSGGENWNISVEEIPLDKADLLNHSACDIKIEFVEKPYIENGKYANALGWASVGSGNIKIVYSSFDYCGKEYNSEFDIYVHSYCFSDNIERSRYMANTVQHEFGHIIGLGHYRGYDNSFTQKWYDTKIGAPSIMAYKPSNEELREITQIDVQKIHEIYGSKGFGNKVNDIPLFREPVIPEPVIVVSEKAEIHLSEGKQSSYFISGDIPDKLFKRGVYLEIIIQKPNGDVEHKAVSVAKTLKTFKHNLIFGYSEPPGKYKISLVFDGTEFDKKEIHISKDSSKNIPKTYSKSTSSIDQDNDGIVDTKDLCNTKPETHNGYKDTDGCPDVDPSRDHDGDGIPIGQDACPTMVGIAKYNGCPNTISKGLENTQDSDRDGFPDVKDNCPNLYSSTHYGCPKSIAPKDADNDRIIDGIDKCPREFALTEDGCPDIKTKPIEKNQSQKINYDEVSIIQKESYEKLNSLKNEVQLIEESLKKLASNSEDQKEKINQAWNLLREGQKNLESIEGRIRGGDNHVGYGNYDTAKDFFDNERIHGEVSKNLKEISKIIEENKELKSNTEELKSQTCFLFWCW